MGTQDPLHLVFHSALHVDLLEAGCPNKLVHFGGRTAAHDPAFAVAIAQNVRDKLELRMPRLIRVNQIRAGFDRFREAAQRSQNQII